MSITINKFETSEDKLNFINNLHYIQKTLDVEANKILYLHKLRGGMSNDLYLFLVNENKYTLRVPSKLANLFIDRKIEKVHLDFLNQTTISSQTLFFDAITGVKIANYIEGVSLKEIDFETYLPLISNKLKELHSLNVTPHFNYNLFERLHQYEQLNEKYDFIRFQSRQNLEIYYNTKKQLYQLYLEHFINDNLTFSHGDIQRSNIVLDKDEKIFFLDFEFASYNNLYYDFASFGNVSIDDSLKLASIYLNRKLEQHDLNKIYFYRTFQALQWHSVAFFKHYANMGIQLQIDFLSFSVKYLELATTLLNKITFK